MKTLEEIREMTCFGGITPEHGDHVILQRRTYGNVQDVPGKLHGVLGEELYITTDEGFYWIKGDGYLYSFGTLSCLVEWDGTVYRS